MNKVEYRRVSTKPSKLQLDLLNPRFGYKQVSSQKEALELLVKWARLSELWHSIMVQGWLDFEPIVCMASTEDAGYFTVLDGNRRVASIKTLIDPELLERPYRNRVPGISKSFCNDLERIDIVVVDDRKDVDAYVGFKHVKGPACWGSLSRAKFTTSTYRRLVQAGGGGKKALDATAKTLGYSTTASMLILIVAIEVLEQAIRLKFVEREEVEANRLDFSRLYTMLPHPATRLFLGWGTDVLNVCLVKSDPVSEEYVENLRYLIGWLFGTEGVSKVISAQGADVPKLQRILGHIPATETLKITGNFKQASIKADADVDYWRSSLIASENQARNLLLEFYEIQSQLGEEHVQDAIKRCGALKSTYNTLLASLKTYEVGI